MRTPSHVTRRTALAGLAGTAAGALLAARPTAAAVAPPEPDPAWRERLLRVGEVVDYLVWVPAHVRPLTPVLHFLRGLDEGTEYYTRERIHAYGGECTAFGLLAGYALARTEEAGSTGHDWAFRAIAFAGMEPPPGTERRGDFEEDRRDADRLAARIEDGHDAGPEWTEPAIELSAWAAAAVERHRGDPEAGYHQLSEEAVELARSIGGPLPFPVALELLAAELALLRLADSAPVPGRLTEVPASGLGLEG